MGMKGSAATHGRCHRTQVLVRSVTLLPEHSRTFYVCVFCITCVFTFAMRVCMYYSVNYRVVSSGESSEIGALQYLAPCSSPVTYPLYSAVCSRVACSLLYVNNRNNFRGIHGDFSYRSSCPGF